MINIQKRAELTQEFKDAVLQAAQDRLNKIKADFEHQHPSFKKKYKEDNGVQIATLKALLSDAGNQDMLWARLRMLPYELYSVETWQGIRYLRGTTKEIVIESDALNLGRYLTYINISDYVNAKTEDLHFVPLRDPLNGLRFFHHYAKGPRYPITGYTMQGKSLRLTHHLDAQPATCWGSFNSFATTAFNLMDTPELFRTLHVYLSRHNDHSNLYPMYADVPRPLSLSFARPM